MNLKTMREQRAKAIADARAILDRAETEKRGLSAEEITSQNAMLADARRIGETIRNAEEIEAEERGAIPESQRTEQRGAGAAKRENTEERAAYLAAFDKYLRNGMAELSGDEQRAIRQGYVAFDEKRSMNVGTGAVGGFTVATDTSMYGRVIEGLKFFGGVEQAVGRVRRIRAEHRHRRLAAVRARQRHDERRRARRRRGRADRRDRRHAVAEDDGRRISSRTKIVLVSWQLLQDASFDIARVPRAEIRRAARPRAEHVLHHRHRHRAAARRRDRRRRRPHRRRRQHAHDPGRRHQADEVQRSTSRIGRTRSG
jgi:hypothetical protein